MKKLLDEIIGGETEETLQRSGPDRYAEGKGYNIARRTVAKYREQLDIPVARLRKEL